MLLTGEGCPLLWWFISQSIISYFYYNVVLCLFHRRVLPNRSGQYSDNEMMKCKICNEGTYVSPEDSPGKGGTDCKVCPTGTDKSTAAGFRACPCVDNYYRTDRFGECHQCPHEGLNCSGEYQYLRPGYWGTWNWILQDRQEDLDSYMSFVSNTN